MSSEHYSTLQLPLFSSVESVREAYLILARACHPDKVAGTAREQVAKGMFQRLNDAYAVLSDPLKKTAYDNQLRARQGVQRRATTSAGRTPHPSRAGSAGLSQLLLDAGSGGGMKGGLGALGGGGLGLPPVKRSSTLPPLNANLPPRRRAGSFSRIGGGGLDDLLGGGFGSRQGGTSGSFGGLGMGGGDPFGSMSSMFDSLMGGVKASEPWGRNIQYEVDPSKRSMKARKMEGEVHRDGRWQTKDRNWEVRQTPSGSIQFSYTDVEVRHGPGSSFKQTSVGQQASFPQFPAFPSFDQFGGGGGEQRGQSSRLLDDDDFYLPSADADIPLFADDPLPALEPSRSQLQLEAPPAYSSPRSNARPSGNSSQLLLGTGTPNIGNNQALALASSRTARNNTANATLGELLGPTPSALRRRASSAGLRTANF